jgi:hypothetical protein
MSKKYTFYRTCVEWPREEVDYLIEMIDMATDITRDTFVRHVNKLDLNAFEHQMGYDDHWKKGLTMSQDWAVSYHRSYLKGERVYYFRHSAIEHVFTACQ